MKRIFLLLLTTICMTVLKSMASAQMNEVPSPTVPEPSVDALKAAKQGVLHFVSHLGSFKSIDGDGRLEFEFKGTVLVTRLQGKVTPTGSIRVEYDKDNRRIYTGSGRLLIEGKWRGVQWFGSNMKGIWWGTGAIRLVGEFDKNLQTGDYWYDNIAEKSSWPATGTITLWLPKPVYGSDAEVTPKERKKGG
ncbi:MAG: hypothetical protein ABUL72_02910 [Armatimonadota bacterium]